MEAYYREGSCYNCKKELTSSHFFYNEMCFNCGELNYAKRNQSCSLVGYRALITGGRLKIGFETTLKLLRAGAEVIVTSRFPNDTHSRYAKELDFLSWQNKLRIFGIDFRHIGSVEVIIGMLLNEGIPIDIIINNAAQTVRRPPIYYSHLIESERKSWRDDTSKETNNKNIIDIFNSSKGLQSSNDNFLSTQKKGVSRLDSLNLSADLSQIPLLPEDSSFDRTFFPNDKYDKDGQQEDRRDFNSWMFELDDINPIEFYEVLNINLIAPFLFNTRLKPLLNKNELPSFIINVTAMEGNFFAPRKSSRHPHTNMAKAALNMMTRTAAKYYSTRNIYMNSVDTGWITNEKPFSYEMGEERKDRMAIDEIDGASRILDPIFKSIISNEFEYGKLYKNYFEYPW